MEEIGWIMGIDLRTSRRDYFLRCLWYKKDTDVQDILNKNAIPAGRIYVKELSPTAESNNDVANIIRTTTTSVTLQTPDDVTGMTQNDFLEHRGVLYVVDSVQVSEQNKQNGFSQRPSAITNIGIRR